MNDTHYSPPTLPCYLTTKYHIWLLLIDTTVYVTIKSHLVYRTVRSPNVSMFYRKCLMDCCRACGTDEHNMSKRFKKTHPDCFGFRVDEQEIWRVRQKGQKTSLLRRAKQESEYSTRLISHRNSHSENFTYSRCHWDAEFSQVVKIVPVFEILQLFWKYLKYTWFPTVEETERVKIYGMAGPLHGELELQSTRVTNLSPGLEHFPESSITAVAREPG